jgi:hypothetical protein
MAATSAGALKAHLEGSGLGLAWFRDEAPEGQALPYGTVRDGISTVPDPDFNPLAGARPVAELVQVDLWQEWRNQATRTGTENLTKAPAVHAALDGVRLPAAPTLVFQCAVVDSRRILERDDNVVHNVWTVRIRRNP